MTLGKIVGEQVQANWFDPRTGKTITIGQINNQGTTSFDPPGVPSIGNDWVLCLYQKARK